MMHPFDLSDELEFSVYFILQISQIINLRLILIFADGCHYDYFVDVLDCLGAIKLLINIDQIVFLES